MSYRIPNIHKRKYILVPDSTEIIRAWDIVQQLNSGRTLREVGKAIGFTAPTVLRFLQLCGYEFVGTKEVRWFKNEHS